MTKQEKNVQELEKELSDIKSDIKELKNKQEGKKSWAKKLGGVILTLGTVWGTLKALMRMGDSATKKVIKGLIKPGIKISAKVGTKAKGGIKALLKIASKKGAEKTTTKIAVKATSKVVTNVAAKEGIKVAAEVGAKAAKELTPKLVEKVAEKTLEKTGSKLLTLGAAKTILKKIPLVSLLAGATFATGRALKGDYAGAAMELGSGALACIPAVGTAASIGMDAAIIGRDVIQGR